ncbi:sodium:solute symporter family transporter [Clostridium aminobutyricum]|uniref:Sodium:solute symporter n=1 Tax=Clostridium aminobutyricum TaxID=33953 RepID=A0A939DBE7_CLOAM|nr:hypothetical protein [Clostridium aminobutyricum]MBN7774168.1 hypothetical protein [Clostridium aminobutyricum]
MILLYVLILYVIYRKIKKKNDREKTIHDSILAGGKVPTWLLTGSIFSGWLWVTSIIGSAEACLIYGISGAIGYAVGASISFLIMIPVILSVQKHIGKGSVIRFMELRYHKNLRNFYYTFALLVAAYVMIEQAAGIGFVFNGIFGVSYKKVSFMVVALTVVFVLLAGMKGTLYNDFISGLIILITFAMIMGIIWHQVGIHTILEGIQEAKEEADYVYHEPAVLHVASAIGIRYFIVSIIIALGQILFDSGYYLKSAIAKDEKVMKRAFLLGGIAIWCPVCFISAITLAFSCVALKIDLSGSQNMNMDLATDLIEKILGSPAAIIFALLILCAGITTIAHYLVGLRWIFTVDFYTQKLKPEAIEKEKIQFGNIIVILIGVFCGLIAISLEDVSLLTIDMFSGVFFAAPCGALLIGLVSKKAFGRLGQVSILLGLFFGFATWFYTRTEYNQEAWILGTMASFAIPFIFLIMAGFFIRKNSALME